ncbi:MAG: hypothetical protein GF344_13370 [Chitinivibrionales bacterium]|nr:hypothetical protein [Chitinivibrionales bacterium]MBD3357720.1 hypothetical protein [Chitinivibrionales bacterium]
MFIRWEGRIMNEKIELLPIEEELRKDSQGIYLGKAKQRLEDCSNECVSILRRGVDPSKFETGTILRNAFDASSKVLETAWRSFHAVSDAKSW